MKRQALAAYAKLPLSFTPNAGQLDRRVRFAAQAGSSGVFLTRTGIALSLAKGKRGVALRLGFLGANPSPLIAGARREPARVNYLLGNDPARWHTNLPTYEEILYRGLWPGVDLRVRGENGRLKYEFRVAPGADASRIHLAYRGQERVSLGTRGELRIDSALGRLRDARPVSYQTIAGKRVAVDSRFSLGRGGTYRFAVGTYEHRYPLVIDPGLLYSTYLGGSSTEIGDGIALDGSGNAYVIGWTDSTDFPTTPGAFDTTLGGIDAFVTKLNAAGSALAYSTYLGGSSSEYGDGLTVDGSGSAYLTGHTASFDFPTTPGAFDTTYNDGQDAFVSKLNPAGSALSYSTYLGGNQYEQGQRLAVESSGTAYIAGQTFSADFPTTAGAFDTTWNGDADVFAAKLNAAGSALVYSTYLGGSGGEGGWQGLAIDGVGSAYLTGLTDSTNFPTTAGAFDTSFNGVADAFTTKLNAAGSDIVYSTYLGGADYDEGGAIAIDGAGSAYITGLTASPNFPTTPGAFDRAERPPRRFRHETQPGRIRP